MRERFFRLFGGAGHEGQFRIDLRRDQEFRTAFLLCLKHVKDRVGIAAEAVAPRLFLRRVAPRH